MKTDSPVLKRLGPIPFWRGESRCLDALAELYAKAATAARSQLLGQPVGQRDRDGKRKSRE